jgi:hypothetical protein
MNVNFEKKHKKNKDPLFIEQRAFLYSPKIMIAILLYQQ